VQKDFRSGRGLQLVSNILDMPPTISDTTVSMTEMSWNILWVSVFHFGFLLT